MKRKGCKTKYGLKIIATVMIFCAVLGGGGYVYAKYFSAAAQWGVAIASGVYLSANYAIENEDFFERVVKTDYAGGNYEFQFEVRNYENNLLFNESGVTVSYSLSFWLGEVPVGATYAVEWQNQTYPIGVGQENKCTLTGQSIAGGSAMANRYIIKIVASSQTPHEAVPIYAEVKTDQGAVINKTLRGKMVLNNVSAPVSYIEEQGFIVPGEELEEAARYARIQELSELVYEVRTVGEVASDELTEELTLSWNPNVLEIDLFDEVYMAWKQKTGRAEPEVAANGWYYITMEVMPYSAQTIYFFRGKDFSTEVVDMTTLNAAVSANK